MTLRILLILGALSAFGPMAIDFYLPSFPVIAEAFATDIEHVQVSLAVYFIGLAVGQLFYGPLADRFGRRWPLLAGITLFMLASLACAFAPTLEWLIVARFLQALGGCAGMVINRAVVRDLCDPFLAARVFSQLMLVMGIAPILAPLLGGVLLQYLGWSSIFFLLALFGALCLLSVWRWLPETAPVSSRSPLTGVLSRYGCLLLDRSFILYALCGGTAMAGMFVYIVASPFVFIDLYGVPKERYGWLFGANALGYILMAQLNARLLHRHGPAYWLQRMVVLYVLGGALVLAVASLGSGSLWILFVPLLACIASLGGVTPNATACAMAGQGLNAGSASGLLGSLQFLLAATAAGVVGLLHDGSAVPMALMICLCASLSAGFAWLSSRIPVQEK